MSVPVAAGVSVVIAAVGAATTAVSAYSAGQSRKASAEANARNLEYQAEQTRATAEIKSRQYAREAKRKMSIIRASYAASGVATSEGTPLLVLMESAEEAATDELRIKQGGEMTAWGLLSQSNIERMKGRSAAQQGAMGAGASLLGGAARAMK